ncbi:DNase I-like protein [Neoconidiobolus thromboides FSU 785]|nr:DNase I-like protein [Neoconidiobolus thromboides FSU 785]
MENIEQKVEELDLEVKRDEKELSEGMEEHEKNSDEGPEEKEDTAKEKQEKEIEEAKEEYLDIKDKTSIKSKSNNYSSATFTTGQRPSSITGLPLKELVNSLLRPTEECLMCCEVKYTRSSGLKEERLLAVIINKEASGEESCIFLLKRNGPRSTTIRFTLPIYSDFKISIFQSKPVNLDDESSINESKNELLIKISCMKKELNLELQSKDSLQFLVAEIKRLINSAVNHNFRPDGITHSWIKYYSVIEQPSSPAHTRANTFSNPMSPLSPYIKASETRTINDLMNPLVMASPNMIDDNLSLEQENNKRLKKIKEEWVAKEMREREAQFTNYEHINIFVGTWNVNGKYSNQPLSAWLFNDSEIEPDLYVLGFQELDLSAEAFLMHDSLREEEWCTAVTEGLGEIKDRYTKLISKQLVGIFLVIFIKNELFSSVSDISLDSAGVGIMGMMGNKGAVAIRIKLKDSYFCFINSHLAADSSQVERRNQDFMDICRRIGFPEPPPLIGPNGTILPLGYGFNPSPFFKTNVMTLPRNPKLNSIYDSDHLIWLGDLNYRLSLSSDQVISRLKNKDYKYLLKYDQLKLQQSAGKVFVGFKEGDIDFQPTYKYDIGTNQFDSSEKKRIPSYCDRILWKSENDNEEGVMEQLSYKAHMELTSSDHKPVSAHFRARVKTFLLDKFQEVHGNLIRELDKFENQIMPDASISCSQLNFGEVKYLCSKELSMTIENTGQVYLQFQFIPKMDESNICKPWLWVNPSNGMIMPGEKLRVNFIMLVDRRSAPTLNMGKENLEDILILHLVRGKDYFISISGNYLPTCFAVPLEYLARLPRPIRQMSNTSELFSIDNMVSVPHVLWRMADFIYQYGMDVENLFLNPGEQETMVYIRECLDTGNEFDLARLLIDSEQLLPSVSDISLQKDNLQLYFEPPPIDPISPPSKQGIHSMAETLIRFLEALPIPVIPFHLYDLCLEASLIGKEAATQALETMPRVHLNTFIYIISLIKEVVAHSNHEDYFLLERLAVVFSSVILRADKDITERFDATLEKKKWFLMFFLVDHQEDLNSN